MREKVIYVSRYPNNCGYLPGCQGCPVLGGIEQAVLPVNELSETNYADALAVIVGEVFARRHMKYVGSDVKALSKQPNNPRNVRCQANRQLGVAMGDAAH